MKRLKSVIIGATISGICAFTIGTAYASRKNKTENSDIIWLDGMNLSDELEPLFDEGDYVYITDSSNYWGGVYNPMEPVRYEVTASKFDAEDETFRYKLRTDMPDDERYANAWVAEEWLDYATKPQLAKQYYTVRILEPEQSVDKVEAEKISAEIDYWLDTIRNSPPEREMAEARLKELAERWKELEQVREEDENG